MKKRMEHDSGNNIVYFTPAICPVCQKAFSPKTSGQAACGLNCFAVMQNRRYRNNQKCKS